MYWSQSYWGGAVAATGGALVFGALRHIVRQPRTRDALLMGLGLAILANSRPLEGLIVSLPVGVTLLYWMLRKNSPALRLSIGRIVLPLLAVFALIGAAMGYYNLRVTGDATRMPYQVYETTYSKARFPLSLFHNDGGPEPTYRHKVMRDFYKRARLNVQTRHKPFRPLARLLKKVRTLWEFYLGFVLTIPLVMLPWVIKDNWIRFALLTCGVLMMAFLAPPLYRRVFPHYAAPITGLIFVVVLQAMRHLHLWQWRGRPAGRFLVRVIPVICIASLAPLLAKMSVNPDAWYLQRARMLDEQKNDGGGHLVIVRYGPKHFKQNEWVYNEADIDGAEVVWAREMDEVQNRKLLEYFRDRQAWLLEVNHDHSPSKLVPYPSGSGRNSDTVFRGEAS